MLSEILVLILAIPVGYLVAWLSRDELVAGRKWFYVLLILSFISIFFGFFYSKPVFYTSIFIAISTSISILKSYDANFVK